MRLVNIKWANPTYKQGTYYVITTHSDVVVIRHVDADYPFCVMASEIESMEDVMNESMYWEDLAVVIERAEIKAVSMAYAVDATDIEKARYLAMSNALYNTAKQCREIGRIKGIK